MKKKLKFEKSLAFPRVLFYLNKKELKIFEDLFGEKEIKKAMELVRIERKKNHNKEPVL